MKKIFLVFLLFIITPIPNRAALAQIPDSNQDAKTQVVIIGTLHEFHYNNPEYPPEVLKEIILALGPAAILNELPLSHVDPNGRPIEKIRVEGYPSGPESWAADTVAQQLGIKQIPFDRPDRNEFYRKTNYFKRQQEYNQQLNSWFEELYAKEPNSLDIKAVMLIGEATKAQGVLSTQKLITPKLINSELYDCIMRIKHASGDIVPEILKKHSAPKSMSDESIFLRNVWSERNKIMAGNIAKAAEEYKGRRLVVITGSEHRYILRDLLKDNPNIELKEYWEVNNKVSVEGIWLGDLKVSGIELNIIFRFSRTSDGTLIATIDSPDQNTNNIPVEKVTLEGNTLDLDVKSINAAFDGNIAKDGKIIEGNWKQSGHALPITLIRASESEIAKLVEAKSHKRLFEPNQLKEDLDFLFKTLEDVHPDIYAYISQSDFAKYKNQLYENITKPKNKVDFYKLIAPVICQLKFGHCNIFPPRFQEFQGQGKIIPLSFELNGNDLIVVKNFTDKNIPEKSKILKINNQPTDFLIDKYSQCWASENKLGDPQWAAKALMFFLWLEDDSAESYLLEIEKPDGLKEQVSMKVITPQEAEALKPEKEIPNNTNFSYEYRPDYKTAILKIKTLNSQLQETFKEFLNESFKKIQEEQTLAVIIDIRGNGGGSSNLGDMLLEYITAKPFRQFEKYDLKISKQLLDFHNQSSTGKPYNLKAEDLKEGSLITQEIPLKTPANNPLRFDGSIFLLTDHFTFSSAQSFASAIKCFGIATIIGEETGGTTTEYGEVMTFTLPNSGLIFNVPCKYFIEACGKPDGQGVIPDYGVKQKPDDTAKGIDTVLQFTLDLIEKEQEENK